MKEYSAVIDGDDSHPITVHARNKTEARKEVKRYMEDIVGWDRFDGPYKITSITEA